MSKPLCFDRDHLLSRIDLGHEVLIPSVGVVSKAEDVPSQDELDRIHSPNAPARPAKATKPEPRIAGRLLSEYAGKTDEEIGKLSGVKPADVAKIRDALEAAAK